MGEDWLQDCFRIPYPEIVAVVEKSCSRMRGLEIEDVCQEVLLHLHKKHVLDGTYFTSRDHVLGTAFLDARRVAVKKLIKTAKEDSRLEEIDLNKLSKKANQEKTLGLAR